MHVLTLQLRKYIRALYMCLKLVPICRNGFRCLDWWPAMRHRTQSLDIRFRCRKPLLLLALHFMMFHQHRLILVSEYEIKCIIFCSLVVLGNAYIFELISPSVWSQTSTLYASTPTVEGYYGYSVAVSNNVTVVGSPRANTLEVCSVGEDFLRNNHISFIIRFINLFRGCLRIRAHIPCAFRFSAVIAI